MNVYVTCRIASGGYRPESTVYQLTIMAGFSPADNRFNEKAIEKIVVKGWPWQEEFGQRVAGKSYVGLDKIYNI